MQDGDIDLSDLPELDADFFRKATLRMPEKKDRISILLDHDLLEWLKAQGRGYQTRINAMLRLWMEAKTTTAPAKK